MTITEIKPGSIIKFTRHQGKFGIGKVTSTNKTNGTVLMHQMVSFDDLQPISGRFGGMVIKIDNVVQIL